MCTAHFHNIGAPGRKTRNVVIADGPKLGIFSKSSDSAFWREGVSMTTITSTSVSPGGGQVEHKPLMTRNALLMMNLGFFGVQFSFGLTQSAVNPLFLLIGATPAQIPILNLAGPVTGLLIQPLIGAISDRTWSPRWGRRRPFITCWRGPLRDHLVRVPVRRDAVVGRAVLLATRRRQQHIDGAVPGFHLRPVTQIATGARVPDPEHVHRRRRGPRERVAVPSAEGVGAGQDRRQRRAVLDVRLLHDRHDVHPGDRADSDVPHQGADPVGRGAPGDALHPRGLGNAVRDIKDAVRTMPVAMHKIGLVFLFQWYAMFIYWQFLAVSLGETVFHGTPETGGPAWDDAIAWSGLMNGAYNFVTMVSALFLVGFAQRMGAKRVHAAALGLAAVALVWLSHITNQYVALVPMIGLGIFWASAVGVPYLMVASMVPAKRTGVYMGILNMMIVVPMLIETVTFGWIFSHLLHNRGSNAIELAGVLMAIGGVAMLWVNPPDEADESPIVPLGSKRSISVYDRVVVGSDGTPTSLYAVDRAAEVAQAAQAQLVVVAAYRRAPPARLRTKQKGCTATSTVPRPVERPWRSPSPVSPRTEHDTSSSGSSPAILPRRCSTQSGRTRRI